MSESFMTGPKKTSKGTITETAGGPLPSMAEYAIAKPMESLLTKLLDESLSSSVSSGTPSEVPSSWNSFTSPSSGQRMVRAMITGLLRSARVTTLMKLTPSIRGSEASIVLLDTELES